MIALANAEEPAKRHHGIFHMAGKLVDHQMMDGAEMLSFTIVDGSSIDLFR